MTYFLSFPSPVKMHMDPRSRCAINFTCYSNFLF